MTFSRIAAANRRGVSAVQIAVVLVLISVALFVSFRLTGTNTSANLNTTAGNIANPASLPARFGS